ncbi:LysM peptidoglycan-binding domain-containing protein [Nocardioides sp. NPDC047086]|uniref:muramidase family protein n=1 Tax=Nocardioides sp. NPDC047086 TaxID=3154810 RepID=UPI0033F70C55
MATSTVGGNRSLDQAEPARKTHTVQPGETLSGIARKYGVKVGDLASWNQIADPAKIRAGAKLVVSAPAKPAEKTYTVVAGDTFSGIAKRFGVEVGELMALNGYQDPTKLLAGSTIEIPAKPTKPKPKPQPGTGETVYTTVAGDTYASVAKNFRITEEELRIYNGHRAPDKLPPGFKLYIPSS